MNDKSIKNQLTNVEKQFLNEDCILCELSIIWAPWNKELSKGKWLKPLIDLPSELVPNCTQDVIAKAIFIGIENRKIRPMQVRSC